MIAFVLAGFACLICIAAVVGYMDARQGAAWREIASARKERWEGDVARPMVKLDE